MALTLSPDLEPLTAFLRSTWESLRWAEALTAPLLVIHGAEDQLIPVTQGRRVFNAAPAPDKTLLEIKGAGHTDLWRSDTLPDIWRFIDRHAS